MTETHTDTWGKTREAYGSHQAAFFVETRQEFHLQLRGREHGARAHLEIQRHVYGQLLGPPREEFHPSS